jgi:predicted DNA-binding protein
MAKPTNVKQVALYVTHKQHAALRSLSQRSRRPMQIYLREAVDDLLAKYGDSVDAPMPPVRTRRVRRKRS